jgi:DNA repair protein SbcD/Mre11
MPIKLIHVSDIHFGSGESHGRLNSRTGLNVRFEDFAAAFARVVDFSLDSGADIFLFSGDAYKNASPEPVYQQAFARQLKRLSDAKIPVVLLVGNHDQIMKPGATNSMSVFQSLEVPGVSVIDRPQLLKVKTRHGKLQVVGLPHVTRHLLMTHQKYAQFSAAEIDLVLSRHTALILQDLFSEIDSKLPCVATAHMMMDTARSGAEQQLMVAYSATFPLSLFCDERLDYVALGHVHSHQILRAEKPVIAYAGSLERVDFSEEQEDKGFIEAEIERGKVSLKFHSIGPRPFITVDADLCRSDDPTAELVQMAERKAREGAVLRIKYRLQQNRLAELDLERLRACLPELLSLRFVSEVVQTERPRRMPDLNEKAVLTPLSALDRYLGDAGCQNKEALLSRARELIEEAEKQDKS